MKIFSICLFRNDSKPAVQLAGEYELSSFGFFQRSSVQEFMQFFARTVSERTTQNQRQSVEQEPYIGHIYGRSDGLCGVIVADKEYTPRVAFTLLNKILDEFTTKYPTPDRWTPGAVPFVELKDYIVKYQDPSQADALTKVQRELDETKIILHKTIEGVLQRGENLDQLIDKSENLSMQSKTFYKAAKKTNSCCVVM